MSEINPNHPVTMAVHNHWHKFAALLMHKMGVSEFRITKADIESLGENMGIVCDLRGGGCVLRLVSEEEGNAMARKEGGLPV